MSATTAQMIEESKSHPSIKVNQLINWTKITATFGNRQILNLASGEVFAGRLLCVLGPSGSGKTTLLNIISKNKKSNGLKISSDISYRQDIENIEDNSAYVHQNDHFFGMLNVYETLHLAASFHRLKDYLFTLNNPSSSNSYDYTNRTGHKYVNNKIKLNLLDQDSFEATINDILDSLALRHTSSTLIGDDEKRGVSGGEKKRLSIACELLSNPKILIADEPTSGLDSYQALNVISILHKIAREKNIGVITTIHQPRTKIWNLLDDILLLTPQGKYAYFGPKDEILAYFSGIGYPCPEHTNPAEFFIDLVSYDTSNPEAYIQSKNRIEEITRHFQLYWKLKASNMTDVTSDTQITANYSDNASVYTTKTYNKVNGYEKKYYMRKLSPTRFIKSRALKFGKFFQSFFGKLAKIVKRPTILINELEYSLRRFSLLLLRASRQTGRDMLTNIVRLLVSGAIAGIVGSVYGYQGADTLGTDNVSSRINIIAQSAINVGMISVIKTIQVFKKEKVIIDRERAHNQYTAFEYLLAKSLADLPFDALNAGFFGLVLHTLTKLKTPAWTLSGVLALQACACASFGLAVGSICPTGDTALAIGPAIMVTYVILGAIGPAGLGKPLPMWLQPIRNASPFRWACEALCASEFKGQRYGNSKVGMKTVIIAMASRMKDSVIRIGRIMTSKVKPNRVSRPTPASIIKQHMETSSSHFNSIKNSEPKSISEGDEVMKNLGIQNSTLENGCRNLLRQLLLHSLVSLIGLIISKP